MPVTKVSLIRSNDRSAFLRALVRPFRAGIGMGVSPTNRLTRAYMFGFDDAVAPRSLLSRSTLSKAAVKHK